MAIFIDNFSIDVENWVLLVDLVSYSVDVVDLSYGISTPGTYFLVDEVPISTTFSGILNGYRATCSAPTVSGSTIVTIHAENTASGISEVDYNFLFGYHIEFPGYIDWGPNNEITILAEAENEVMCSNKEIFATYFKTRDLEAKDLRASIVPVGWANLGAEIYPQSKYFFYGQTYSVTVSGIRDFAGNILQAFTFNFTIEDE